MTTKFTINKLNKAGANMKQDVYSDGSASNRWAGEINGHEVSFLDQHGDVVCLRARVLSDEDDIYSDYHAGSFFDSVKWCIDYCQR